MDEPLRALLLAWIADDDRTRARLAADGSLHRGYHPEMEAVHRVNAARLREVVDAGGWPGRARVGDEGASAAFRILQHAIGEPELLRAYLPRLQDAAARGDVDPAEVAMLEDRIRVSEGRLQRYGTQYDWSDDGAAMVPMNGVEAPEGVDRRRAEVGLPPMVWRRPPPEGEAPPEDLARRRAEMEAWARRVGWR
ncbi:MAG: DUF6624 domain-containing protein [Nannocystaceae bacterium]